MPLMMEVQEDQYMDDDMGDLFGESEEVPLTPAPVIKGLPLRLDELASTYCCQKIAWSRMGCLASISKDGRSVDIYTFVRDTKTGNWNLSKAIPIWPLFDEMHHVVHISWSYMGTELAMVGSSGRIVIYTNASALGSMSRARQHANDLDDDLSALVGLHWFHIFPHIQKSPIVWSASRSGDDWNIKVSSQDSYGPHNPVEGKSALICLSKSGALRLLYQQRDGSWLETATELEDSSSAIESSFTHASFAPDVDNSLLLVAHQLSGSLRLFRIQVNWNSAANQDDGQPVEYSFSSPTLEVSALLEEDSCLPTNTLAFDQHNSVDATLVAHNSYQLTSLELLPNPPEFGKESSHGLATIMAVFTVLPPPPIIFDSIDPSVLLPDTTKQYQRATSVISRWNLIKGAQNKLPPCFEHLSVKKKSTTAIAPRHCIRLERLPDISCSSAILSSISLRNNTMFAFSMSDGNTYFRYRDTMDIVIQDGNDDEVHTLPQSGFSFPRIDPPSLCTALSPNACVVAFVKPDGVVKLESMKYDFDSLTEIPKDDPKEASLAAVIALQHAYSCMQYRSSDDLLSILPTKLSETMTHSILSNATKFLSVTNFDYVSDEGQKHLQMLYKNHFLFKCLSIQNILGSLDNKGAKKLSARLAWITINLRLVSVTVSMGMRSDQNLKAELALSYVGLVRWSLDLFIYLLQEMFRFYYEIKHKAAEGQAGLEEDREWIHNYIRQHHSPALIVLLSSIPRMLLRLMFRPLRSGQYHSANGIKTSLPLEHKLAFGKLLGIFQTTPVTCQPFEQYLQDVDSLVKSCYKSLSLPERSLIEKNMLLTATIPDILMPVVTAMLTTKMDALMSQQDPGKIHGHDVLWLGLTDDKRMKAFLERQRVDVIRKLPLRVGARMRRCTRCGSVMEDIQAQVGHGGVQQEWVSKNQKTCVCFASWAVVAEGT
ncbi:hypothetical protein EJ08DRAFT_235033 [Tothia fuscella]|uniref:Mediator of RNA polymerase II transcription subunit 16 n=1 Tax=Tothia fuscella TaxID=1048955 RepID=A0A9P4NRS7_9PEZI|nr:hypothetical protein EJ08DRAFT_235033 [Tothia fuscella]